jgi:putative ABC transport system permease protein
MHEGRFFSRNFIADTSALVINETAVPYLEFEEPVGQLIYSAVSKKNYTVVGVVKDFHYASLHESIKPAGFMLQDSPARLRYTSVRIHANDLQETIGIVKRIWNSFSTGLDFQYSFLDDDFNSLYRTDQRIGRIAFIFSAMAILISCLGLFGLATFTAQRRTKEIGIRKVLGSTVTDILLLLMKAFTKYVILANLIAWPTAYFIMNRWLNDFAYRIHIGVDIFILSGLTAFGIAVLTVIFQSVKAARINPVEALRCE